MESIRFFRVGGGSAGEAALVGVGGFAAGSLLEKILEGWRLHGEVLVAISGGIVARAEIRLMGGA